MNRYKVFFGGRGADLYLHKIDEDQKKMLSEMKIEDSDNPVDFDKLNEILKVEYFDHSEESYTGIYASPEHYNIVVLNDEGEKIWESDDSFYLDQGDEDDDYIILEKKNELLIVDYIKGTIKEYILEIEEKFDPSKMTYKSLDINEEVEIITDLKYDNKVMETEEWGDYWSKGVYFSIL